MTVHRVRVCGCGHEATRHRLVDGKHMGECTHGCGCDHFHSRRRGEQPVARRPPTPRVSLKLPLQQAFERLAQAASEIARALGGMQTIEMLRPASPSPTRHRSPNVSEAALGEGAHLSNDPPAEKSLNGAATRKATRAPGALGKGERAVLTATMQHPHGLTRSQLTVLTGYKRSTRDSYLARLRDREYLYEQSDGRIIGTTLGEDALGNYERLPTGRDLCQYHLKRLPEGERRVLEVLVECYPSAVARDVLSETLKYARSSRDAYVHRLVARELAHVMKDGGVKANGLLFDS